MVNDQNMDIDEPVDLFQNRRKSLTDKMNVVTTQINLLK